MVFCFWLSELLLACWCFLSEWREISEQSSFIGFALNFSDSRWILGGVSINFRTPSKDWQNLLATSYKGLNRDITHMGQKFILACKFTYLSQHQDSLCCPLLYVLPQRRHAGVLTLSACWDLIGKHNCHCNQTTAYTVLTWNKLL